ncbi:hypothetical protein N7471_010336 [Penicillium samsonianum]|uniref:uncharacterized protein n=1 Tax=Penicillium samsonianum TaxID=1882272 RepID=UPI002546BF7A|nr:uncharacterized protein N7471_010336 [Penicillium samsonianum]KAJ6125843.1 hypothetical protein N7471_010336 [Penicillium samsonianum]
MCHLQIATWDEYQGCARVKYDLIDIHPEKRKLFLEKDAKWWEEILKNDKGVSDELAHAPIIVVSKDALENARRRSHSPSNHQAPPTLVFRHNEMLCLDGQSRIRAALNSVLGLGTSGFGAVHIVLDSINDAQRDELLYDLCHQIRPDCGQLYASILNSENLEERHKNQKLKSTLGSIEKYLLGYILAFWEGVVRKTQSRTNSSDQFHLGDIPTEAFKSLQGLIPGISEIDRSQVREVFARPALGSLSRKHRRALKKSILKSYCMIPSMALFSVHMRVLEKASICMKKLLELDGENRKRGQGCANPLENVLKRLYTAERNVYDEYQIQTTNGWRTIRAPFEDRQELSCRQLWLFVMRHDDPAALDQGHLAYMAKQLGFYSVLIEVDAAKHGHVGHDQAAKPHPVSWTEDSSVSIDERLGQKGGRWLARTKQARNHLFFDVAETIGTKAAQKFQKLITVTPLVELACIYRALFGDPFSPSKYAEIPRAEGHASSGSLAKAKTSSELSPPSREPSDCGHGSENESIYYDALIVPCGDPPMTAFERPEEEQNNLEGHSYLQLCKVAENGDPPAGSSTKSQMDLAEPEIYGDRSPGRSTDFSIVLQSNTNSVPAPSRTLNDRCLTEPDRQGDSNLGGHSYLQLCKVAENGDPPAGSSTQSQMDFAEPEIYGDRSPGRSTDFSIVLQPETNGVPAASRTLNERCLTEPDRQGDSNLGGHSYLQLCKAVERGDPPARSCILNDRNFDEPQIDGDRSPRRSTYFSIVLQSNTNRVPAVSRTLNDRCLMEPDRQRDSNLEGYSYLQLCKAAENGDPPAGSSTKSQMDLAEPEIYGDRSPGRSTDFSIVLQSNTNSVPAVSRTLNDRCLMEPDRQRDSNLEGYSYLQLCKAAENGDPPAGSSTQSQMDFAEPEIYGDRSPGRSTDFSIVLQPETNGVPAASRTLNERCLTEPDRQGDSNLGGHSYLQLCKAVERGDPPARSCILNDRNFDEPQIDGDRSPRRSTYFSIVLQSNTNRVPAVSRTLNDRCLMEPDRQRDSNLEGYSYLQLCKAAENGDPPAGSSTKSQMDLAEPEIYGDRSPGRSTDFSIVLQSNTNSVPAVSRTLNDRCLMEPDRQRDSNLEGYSYLQLCKAAENGDPPAGSSTQSQMDFAEPEIYGDRSPGRSTDFSIVLQPETNGVPAPIRTLNDRCLTEPDRQGDSNLGGHSYLQLCKVAENGDPPAGSSTPSHRDFAEPEIYGDRSPGRSTDFSIVLQPETNGVPAASRTLNNRSLNEPETNEQYFSEICAVNSFSPVESKAGDRSVSTSSTSSPITGSVQATGNGNNLHYHGDSSAGSIISNVHSLIAPAIQGDGSAEISTSTSSHDIPGEFQADRPSVSELSPFSPMAGPNWTKVASNTLRWLDLARLHQPLRIPPIVEGFCVTYPPLTRSLPTQKLLHWNGAAVTSLEPSTKIQIQEQVDWREMGENDGANQRDCLNYLESLVVDSPPISPYPVEEMQGSQHCPAAVAVNLGKNGLLEQNSLRAQDTSEYVASISGHKDQVERIRQTQPQSHSSKTARAEPEEIHSLEQSEPVKTTYRSDPFSIGFQGSCQEHLPTSLLGDISQHRDCMSLFSPSSCSDGESDLEGGVLNTADATMLTKDKSIGSATSSAKSIKAHWNPILTSNERCPPLVSQNSPHMARLAPCGQDYRYIDPENHYLSSQMSRTSTLPSHATRTVSDRTAAGQEQPGKSVELAESTQTAFWCPRGPPTEPESHSGKYAQGRHGITDSRSLQTVVENVNEDFSAATGQPGNGDLPEATKLGHDPCTSPFFREDSRFVQDETTRLSDRELQQQLSERNDGLVGRSNQQPPMVEDVDVVREESNGPFLERPVGHLVAPLPPDRSVDPPVGPAIIPVLDPIQDPGPPRDSATAPVNQRSCPSKDGISAAGRIGLPTPASNEPYLNRASVVPETIKKRKWQGSEPDEWISKRSCIESPVRERLDGTLKWAMPWHRTVSARHENSQVHGPRSIAATEELLAFLQRCNATGQPGNGDLPEATKLGHDPCTSPFFREDSRFVQDETTRLSDRELQQQLSERNDGLVGRSNQQPPMVEDMDVVREESNGSVLERPVGHLVAPLPPDRSVDPPVGPSIVPVLDPIQDPGPPRDSATGPVNQRSCPVDPPTGPTIVPVLDPIQDPGPPRDSATGPVNQRSCPVDPPTGPTIVPVLDPIQDPGPPRDSATAPVNQRSCPIKDGISAAGRIGLPTPASNEPYLNRASVVPETIKKRKWQGSEPDEWISKRSCIESPVRERLDGTLKWAMPWHRTVSARHENSQVHGPRSIAATEELLAFLQRCNATGQPGNGDLPEATKLGHDPCISPFFREDSRFVQDETTRLSDRELQQQLSERNDGLVGRSNQQPPMVEDVDVVHEESNGSVLERPVSHLVAPLPPGRSVDPPVGPSIVPVLDPIQDPGPPRDSATGPVNQRSCPVDPPTGPTIVPVLDPIQDPGPPRDSATGPVNKRSYSGKDGISAAGRIGLPTPASNEPYPNRAEVVPEYQGESSYTIPACTEAPRKRFCLGLDSPRGFPLAPGGSASDNQGETICADTELGSPAETPNDVNISAQKNADDFVFIVELVGHSVKLRSKSGNFFNRDLRIVELDLSKSGATHMDIFFETEEVEED